jgi:hypothetical protein
VVTAPALGEIVVQVRHRVGARTRGRRRCEVLAMQDMRPDQRDRLLRAT